MSWVTSRIKWVKLPETTDITQVMVDSAERKTERSLWTSRVFLGALVATILVLTTLLACYLLKPTVVTPEEDEWTRPVHNVQVEYAGRACGDTTDCARAANELRVSSEGSMANFFLGGDGNIYPHRGWHHPALLNNRTSYLMLMMGDWSRMETPKMEVGALHRVIREGLSLGYLDTRWRLSHESNVSHGLRRLITLWYHRQAQHDHHSHSISLRLGEHSPNQPNATAHPH